MLPLSSLQPNFARLNAELVWMLPSLGLITGIASLVMIVIALGKRRRVLTAIPVIGICLGFSFLCLRGDMSESAWVRNFASVHPQLDLAVQSVRNVELNEEKLHHRLILPPKFASLSMKGQVAHYLDEETREVWFLFPQFMAGLDNGVGYAWSASGKPPPSKALYDIVRTRTLGGGWYMFWTT